MATFEKGSQVTAILVFTFFWLTLMPHCLYLLSTCMDYISCCGIAFHNVHHDFVLQLLYIYIYLMLDPTACGLLQRTCLRMSHDFMTVITI